MTSDDPVPALQIRVDCDAVPLYACVTQLSRLPFHPQRRQNTRSPPSRHRDDLVPPPLQFGLFNLFFRLRKHILQVFTHVIFVAAALKSQSLPIGSIDSSPLFSLLLDMGCGTICGCMMGSLNVRKNVETWYVPLLKMHSVWKTFG
jgi:hypothetical protein